MTAMNSLSVRLQTLIRESLHTTKTGCVVVHSECLSQLWSAITKVYPVPSWKRFAAFVASTGGKFEVNEPGTRHVEYKAHIILMIFFECGLHIDAEDFNRFLRAWQQTQTATVGPSTAALESDEVLSARSSVGGVEPAASSSSAFLTSGANFSRVGRHALSRVGSGLQGGSFSESNQFSEVDVAALLQILEQRDNKIATLKSEKKHLQQQNRRLAGKLLQAKQQCEDQEQSHKRKQDFDVLRVNDLESKKLKWSWMTPTGCINAAAS